MVDATAVLLAGRRGAAAAWRQGATAALPDLVDEVLARNGPTATRRLA